VNKFGKKCTKKLSLKFGVLIVGEIEWQLFLPNAVRQPLFAWQKSLVKSTPVVYFKTNLPPWEKGYEIGRNCQG